MSTKLKIKLLTFDEIKRFANKVVLLESDVDIIKGIVIYDAKSIIGVLNMGTLDGVFLKIHSENEGGIQKFNELMDEFTVQ